MKQIITYSIIIISLGLIHLLCISHFELLQASLLYNIYIFLAITTAILSSSVKIISDKWTDKAGYSFMAFGIIKMMLSLVFIYPMVRPKTEISKVFVINFMIAYFIFLFFETLYFYKRLNSK